VTDRGDEFVGRWTREQVWDAVDEWRWIPPSAQRVVTDEYELAVTPGSYALTYVYGFRVDEPARAEERLLSLRKEVQARGGTGVRFQLTPRTRPSDLGERLERHGYRAAEEADVLVWELRNPDGGIRLPEFPDRAGISVREVRSDPEYETFGGLGTLIFGDPAPSEASRTGFLAEFHRKLEEDGHSDRFLAVADGAFIGRGGLELAGPVARFWGSGVLPAHRGRGAYGALVRARCESAAARGSEIVLVTARVGTSGPILKRHGFEPVGSVRVYEARW